MTIPLKAGLIGTGFMGEFHARAYATARRVQPSTPVLLNAVADVVPGLAESFARRWQIPLATQDWRAIIADPDIDIVDICAPPQAHRQVALAAIEAGKHVYCEKPVGISLTETNEIAAAARSQGVRTFVGFNYRWFPAIQHAKALIDGGAIGGLRHIRMAFQSDWASDPSVPWAWRLDAATSGFGALSDVGSHIFDMARLLGGELSWVSGSLRTFITSRPFGDSTRAVDTDDSFDAIGHFANGAAGEFHGSRVATGSKVEFRVEIVGEAGALRWEVGRLNELRLYSQHGSTPDQGFQTIMMGPEHPYQADFSPVQGLGLGFEDSKAIELAAFLRSISLGIDSSPTFDDAASVAAILEAVASGERVTFPAPPGTEA